MEEQSHQIARLSEQVSSFREF